MLFTKPQTLSLLVLLFLTAILRLPSLFEPYWYGDELIRLIVAHQWFAGTKLYSGIFDNSPPVLYLIFGLAPNIFWLKFLAIIWVLGAVSVFYFIAIKIGQELSLGKFYPGAATLIFIILTSTPIFEGNIATAEIFALLPALAGIFLVLRKKEVFDSLVNTGAGVFFALATLIRIQSVTDFAAAATFLLFAKNLKAFSVLIVSFCATWFLVLLVFWFKEDLYGLTSDVFFGNLNYVNYANRLGIPFGLLGIKTGILIILIVLLSKFKKGKKSAEILTILWLFFSIFGSLVGGRNYSHYFLQITPPVALISARVLAIKLKNNLKTIVVLVMLAIISVMPLVYPRPFSYYLNFFNYFGNYQKYINWFDPRVTQSKIIASYIRQETGPNDEIFVLGNSPEIYLLSQRKPAAKYVVSYHLNFQPNARGETLSKLSQQPAKIMVVFEEGRKDFPNILPFLEKNYKFLVKIGKGEIWINSF